MRFGGSISVFKRRLSKPTTRPKESGGEPPGLSRRSGIPKDGGDKPRRSLSIDRRTAVTPKAPAFLRRQQPHQLRQRRPQRRVVALVHRPPRPLEQLVGVPGVDHAAAVLLQEIVDADQRRRLLPPQFAHVAVHLLVLPP